MCLELLLLSRQPHLQHSPSHATFPAYRALVAEQSPGEAPQVSWCTRPSREQHGNLQRGSSSPETSLGIWQLLSCVRDEN